MAKLEVKGLEEWILRLDNLSNTTEEICKKALMEAAEIVKEKYKASTASLPTDEKWGTQKKQKRGLRAKDKQGLLDSLGIAPIEKKSDGAIDTKVGYHLYNKDGKANQMIARAANSGTSFMKKTGYIDKTNRASKPLAEAKIKEVIESEINKLNK